MKQQRDIAEVFWSEHQTFYQISGEEKVKIVKNCKR